ncbi:tRNA guanosine(34) transglycosylase Tgt [Patescibacteria group bacterium]|nr:tRNA guanosine(34) transglycosylase Tgt [Patescibacteria group bacterium]MBU1721556.1 tRNA guanosine(34) transglycosylase Tgt [Patescibacteria group bacterium]MBU1901466.1 tRNA guanosine(34) transglycosylase Tgt [Patescibacteria group bacterium]
MFTITSQSNECAARTGIIKTDHGDIETPIFMPVGTKATVKTLTTEDLERAHAQIILGNTYHLHLQPHEDLIAEFGGLHTFMGWDKPILTDSGGFQVFSLGAQKKDGNTLAKIDEEGVTFRSHIDGSTHRFTPEEAIRIQHKIGADIIMAFDECTPDDAEEAYAIDAMERTHRWAERCITEHKKNTHYHGYQQFLFGIIQGGNHKELRQASAKAISAMDFDGIAIGGESIGYNMKATKEIMGWINDILPKDKAHYTMGVGYSPIDLFDVVEMGVDMFDCVAPTRMARNGSIYVMPQTFKELDNGNSTNKRKLWIDIGNSRYKNDHSPLDPRFDSLPHMKHYTRAYLHHLFKANEMLGLQIATLHNIHFLLSLMEKMREAIKADRFFAFRKEWGLK